ncbi:MAG: response regulator [Candidatus Marinimicrobia bacterium]|nr:response regulator [Candidatus Neomarinimicrobiota bacterium]MCF7850367.1 response regulator [Candidatus Neomarinimicrobiota bacterium]MCF7904492.1 response regulator [Candidatus Neomarinimicrobiota bacterium]
MKNLLIVDDDEDIRLIVGMVLKSTGKYSVIEAENGKAGGDILQNQAIDVLILDYLLPDGKGSDLFDEWKQTGLLDSVRVLMLTARQDAELTKTLLASGIDRIMHKPFDPGSLVAELETLSGS